MRTSLLLSCLLLLAAVPGLARAGGDAAPAGVAEQPPRASLMMWHLSPGGGASPELATRMERVLRRALEEAAGERLLKAMVMDSLLLVEGNEKYLRCGMGPACLAGLGQAAGLQQVIAGEVAKHGGTVLFHLVLVDVAQARVMSRCRVESALQPSPGVIAEMVTAMLHPRDYRGRLVVLAGEDGAEVLLDDRPVGHTPLDPLEDLVAGEHRLLVRKPGFIDFSRRVRVPYKSSVTVEVELVRRVAPRRPFWADWPFWTAAGVGAALLGVGGGLYYDAGILDDNLQVCIRDGCGKEDEYRDRVDARKTQAYVMFGLGGAGLAAAGIIALIDVASAGPEAAGRDDNAPRLEFTPLPGGGMLGFGWRY